MAKRISKTSTERISCTYTHDGIYDAPGSYQEEDLKDLRVGYIHTILKLRPSVHSVSFDGLSQSQPNNTGIFHINLDIHNLRYPSVTSRQLSSALDSPQLWPPLNRVTYTMNVDVVQEATLLNLQSGDLNDFQPLKYDEVPFKLVPFHPSGLYMPPDTPPRHLPPFTFPEKGEVVVHPPKRPGLPHLHSDSGSNNLVEPHALYQQKNTSETHVTELAVDVYGEKVGR
jgi:hypothetical protein